LEHHVANHHEYQLELARQAFILETNVRLGPMTIESNDTKPSGDSNCTSFSEDSARPSATKENTKDTTTTNEREIICTALSEDFGCPPATTMTTVVKLSPTYKEHAKGTTTIKEREIILKTEKAKHNPNQNRIINETTAPTTLKSTKKPRARFILIKLRNDHLVKANSTHFHKWTVIETKDENYPHQDNGDIDDDNNSKH
jgi:hypothetical protein